MEYYENIHFAFIYSALYAKNRVLKREYIQYMDDKKYRMVYRISLIKDDRFKKIKFTNGFYRALDHISSALNRKIFKNIINVINYSNYFKIAGIKYYFFRYVYSIN